MVRYLYPLAGALTASLTDRTCLFGYCEFPYHREKADWLLLAQDIGTTSCMPYGRRV